MDPKHQQALIRNNVLLVQDMHVDEMFLSYFMEGKVLMDNHMEEILTKATKAEKAGEFIRIIKRRGPKAMKRLIEALVATGQDHIADKLDPALSSQAKVPSGVQTSGVQETTPFVPPQLQPTAPPNIDFDDQESSSFIDIEVAQVNTKSQEFLLRLNDKDDVYEVKHRQRGRAVIISNEIFENERKNREGTNFDMINLDSLLQKLGYDTIVHSDKTAMEISDILAKESKHKDHAISDSFILAMFSHGAKGEVFGTDFKPVRIEETVKAFFDGKHCPLLAGKPKLFIIQACQGRQSTEGVPIADAAAEDTEDEASLRSALERLQLGDGDQQDAVPWNPDVPATFSSGDVVHAKGDMIVAYSTVSGYKSWRLPDKGSWFIRALVKVFMHYAHSDHILELLTRVRRVVSEKKTNLSAGGLYVQMPASDDTLRKKWYLFPGYQP